MRPQATRRASADTAGVSKRLRQGFADTIWLKTFRATLSMTLSRPATNATCQRATAMLTTGCRKASRSTTYGRARACQAVADAEDFRSRARSARLFELSVENRGEPIPKQSLNKLFQSFERTLVRKVTGWGRPLYCCRNCPRPRRDVGGSVRRERDSLQLCPRSLIALRDWFRNERRWTPWRCWHRSGCSPPPYKYRGYRRERHRNPRVQFGRHQHV